MISLRLATDSTDGKCLHNFFSPLRLLDCRFLRCPLPAIEKHWSAGSLAVEKLSDNTLQPLPIPQALTSAHCSRLITFSLVKFTGGSEILALETFECSGFRGPHESSQK